MKDLNEQIIFFKNDCLENSYLNEDDQKLVEPNNEPKELGDRSESKNTTPEKNLSANLKPFDNLNQAEYWYTIAALGQTPEEREHAKKMIKQIESTNVADLNPNEYEKNIDNKAEENEENKEHKESINLDDAVSLSIKKELNVKLEKNKFKIIPLEDYIEFKTNFKNIEIISEELVSIKADPWVNKVICAPYVNLDFDKLAKKILDFSNKEHEIDSAKIEAEAEKIANGFVNKNSKFCIFLYGLEPVDNVDIVANFNVLFNYNNEKYETTFSSTIGTAEVINFKIEDIQFQIPFKKTVLSINDSINLKEYLYAKLAGSSKFVKYLDLDQVAKNSIQLTWHIEDYEVKNVFTLEDGNLTIPQKSYDSFKKLIETGILDSKDPSFDVIAYDKNNTAIVTKPAKIFVLDNKNKALNFAVFTSSDASNNINESEYDANFYEMDCFAGGSQKIYVSITPDTALPEYYAIDCSANNSSILKVTQGKNELEYNIDVDSNIDISALKSKEDRTINIRLVRYKSEQSGKPVIDTTITKKIVLTIFPIPQNLSIKFNPDTPLELENNTSKHNTQKAVYYDILDDDAEIDIKDSPYNMLVEKGDVSVGFLSLNENIATVDAYGNVSSVQPGDTTIYVYLMNNNQDLLPSANIPKELRHINNIVSFDQKHIYVNKIIHQFSIDVPPRPSAYKVIMAPVIGGKSSAVFGIRHYTLNPEREIESTNDRATSLLNSSNPVKFFSNVIGKYMGQGNWSVKTNSNTQKRRASNAAGRDYEVRGMNRQRVNQEFRARNASTWTESLNYNNLLALNEAKNKNAIDFQKDLQLCVDYFKEVFNQYINALNIIYGDDTKEFADAIKNTLVNEFVSSNKLINNNGFNPISIYSLVQSKIRAAAGSLMWKNNNFALYKKLGTELDEFAENTNKTMVDKIEGAFAGIFDGKVKGIGNDSEKTKTPVKQAELKNLWFGYFKKLKRDAIKFQDKFANSETVAYSRKVLSLTIPDILALDIAAIATIIEKNSGDLGFNINEYDWAGLFNFVLTTSERNSTQHLQQQISNARLTSKDRSDLLNAARVSVNKVITQNNNVKTNLTDADIKKLFDAALKDKDISMVSGKVESAFSLCIDITTKINSNLSVTPPNYRQISTDCNNLKNNINWNSL